MKINRILALCGIVAALYGSAHNLAAQNDSGAAASDNNQGGNRRSRGGGQGGGNFDPAQFQQRIMERVRTNLGFTNDTDWSAVEPLIQKVMDAQRNTRGSGMGRMFGRSRGGNNSDQGGNNNRGGGMFGQSSPEADALQKALDDNAPAGQIKTLLAKYKSSQKDKQAKLEAAQADLCKILTVKQEAQATLLGLLN